jgi:hypothetical protein
MTPALATHAVPAPARSEHMRARRNAIALRAEGQDPALRGARAQEEVRLVLDHVVVRISVEGTGQEPFEFVALDPPTLQPRDAAAATDTRAWSWKRMSRAVRLFFRRALRIDALAMSAVLVAFAMRWRNVLWALNSLLTERVVLSVFAASSVGLLSKHLQQRTRIVQMNALGSCVICCEGAKSHVLVDCGHLALCQTCCNNVLERSGGKCPLCRKAILAAPVKVYF